MPRKIVERLEQKYNKILEVLQPKGKTFLSKEEIAKKTNTHPKSLYRYLNKLKNEGKIKCRPRCKYVGLATEAEFYIPPSMEDAIKEVLQDRKEYKYDDLHKIALVIGIRENTEEFKKLFFEAERKFGLILNKHPLVNISVQKNES